jgi:3-deoxy-7-phosphoheptulonate synthase
MEMLSSNDKIPKKSIESRPSAAAASRLVTVRSGNTSVEFGGKNVVVIAGPCSIESRAHLLETATAVCQAGARMLRGGIFKMRTSPAAFQGLGEPAFEFLNEIKETVAAPLVSEITDARQVESLGRYIDMFQVGSRNMYNYELLKELGRQKKPVMLKRSFAATVDEWLKAADYILAGGNDQVVLCERGIRTFETSTRNTLDLNAVAYIKAHTPFAVIVDPSHGTGRPELIPAMALAAVAAGADGIMIEVHPRPKEALSDGFQALRFEEFSDTMKRLKLVAAAVGREIV